MDCTFCHHNDHTYFACPYRRHNGGYYHTEVDDQYLDDDFADDEDLEDDVGCRLPPEVREQLREHDRMIDDDMWECEWSDNPPPLGPDFALAAYIATINRSHVLRLALRDLADFDWINPLLREFGTGQDIVYFDDGS